MSSLASTNGFPPRPPASHRGGGPSPYTLEMLLDAARAALVLVDYQSRLMPAIHDAEKAIRHAVYLARVARALGVPVVGTEQNPRGLGPNDERVRVLCDLTVGKMHFNACGDGLVEALRGNGREVREV